MPTATKHTEGDSEWMKPAEAAAVLGVSTKTLARLADSGGLPAQRLGATGQRRYRRSDINARVTADAADAAVSA